MGFDLEKKINVGDLLDPSNIGKVEKAIEVIQKAQNNIAALKDGDDPDRVKIQKLATSLTIAVIKKKVDGKLPTDYSEDDWKEIVEHISNYAVKADDMTYSAYVFMFYAWFIETSVPLYSTYLAESKQAGILALADEIKARTDQLGKGEINEVNYVESCLWLCLEAMIKLVSGTIDTALQFDKAQVVEAAMTLGMEYARFVLYKREHELLTEYLKNQKILDVELAMQYDRFMEDLNNQAREFEVLIDKAFEPNFGEMLMNSVALARAAGVDESELLKTTEEVDDYFL